MPVNDRADLKLVLWYYNNGEYQAQWHKHTSSVSNQEWVSLIGGQAWIQRTRRPAISRMQN